MHQRQYMVYTSLIVHEYKIKLGNRNIKQQ